MPKQKRDLPGRCPRFISRDRPLNSEYSTRAISERDKALPMFRNACCTTLSSATSTRNKQFHPSSHQIMNPVGTVAIAKEKTKTKSVVSNAHRRRHCINGRLSKPCAERAVERKHSVYQILIDDIREYEVETALQRESAITMPFIAVGSSKIADAIGVPFESLKLHNQCPLQHYKVIAMSERIVTWSQD